MVKAVFLDIDGTLMDTNYLHIEAWAQAFEEVGSRPPRSRIHHDDRGHGAGIVGCLARQIIASARRRACTEI